MFRSLFSCPSSDFGPMAMTEQNQLAYGAGCKGGGEGRAWGPTIFLKLPPLWFKGSQKALPVLRVPMRSRFSLRHCVCPVADYPACLAAVIRYSVSWAPFSFSNGKFSRWPVTICLPLTVWDAGGYQNVEVGRNKGRVGSSQWELLMDINSKTLPQRKQGVGLFGGWFGIASNYPKIL